MSQRQRERRREREAGRERRESRVRLKVDEFLNYPPPLCALRPWKTILKINLQQNKKLRQHSLLPQMRQIQAGAEREAIPGMVRGGGGLSQLWGEWVQADMGPSSGYVCRACRQHYHHFD